VARQADEAAYLAYRDPTQQIVYDNYVVVRKNLDFLKSWISDRLADLESGRTPQPQKIFGWYWLANSVHSEHFNHEDVVFECFHDFVALSQWGHSLHNTMVTLLGVGGDDEARRAFASTMAGDFRNSAGGAFPPLTRLVMEFFRKMSPNGGSISTLTETRRSRSPTARPIQCVTTRGSRRSASAIDVVPVSN